MNDIKIEEFGKGKFIVFTYEGSGDPVHHLDENIKKYVGEIDYREFVDMNMDNPWIRIVWLDNK